MSSSRELHAHFFCSKALEKHKKTNQTISHQKLSEGKGEEREEFTQFSSPPALVHSGSVGIGSMGSWKPINFRTVGSGTHQFWKYPFFKFQNRQEIGGLYLEIAFWNPLI